MSMFNVNVECQMSACLVKMIWVKGQHAQAQQWLMHAHAWAEAQHWIMHTQPQAQAQLQRKWRPARVNAERQSVSKRIRVNPYHVRPDPCRCVSSRIHVRLRQCHAVSSRPRVHAQRAILCQTAACHPVSVTSAPPCNR